MLLLLYEIGLSKLNILNCSTPVIAIKLLFYWWAVRNGSGTMPPPPFKKIMADPILLKPTLPPLPLIPLLKYLSTLALNIFKDSACTSFCTRIPTIHLHCRNRSFKFTPLKMRRCPLVLDYLTMGNSLFALIPVIP